MEPAGTLTQTAGSEMPEPKGRTLPLSIPRRFIGDMVHYARRIPTIPVARVINVGELAQPRQVHSVRPSWSVLFMKAYALVAAEHPPLRRALLTFPWCRLYEHSISLCSLAVERKFQGEEGIFVGLFRAPEKQSLQELQRALAFYKTQPLESIGFFRQELRICAAPWFIRRLLWWSTLNVGGAKRAKRLGTFGLTTYGSLGAEQIHPISPLTTTLTFGPIDDEGQVCLKLIYDHRVLDGAYVARRLGDIERALHGPILSELKADSREAARFAASPAA
jgi:hypothetical protein